MLPSGSKSFVAFVGDRPGPGSGPASVQPRDNTYPLIVGMAGGMTPGTTTAHGIPTGTPTVLSSRKPRPMMFKKTLLAAAALVASVGANANVTGSLGSGVGPFLTLNGGSAAPCTAATCSLGAPTNTIAGGKIYTGDQGFADIPKGTVTSFLAAGPSSTSPAILTFGGLGVSFVSFLWGSPDTYNSLTITDTLGSTYSFGNGGPGYVLPGDGNQSFSAYVAFNATGALIRSLTFSSASTDAFEVANFSITPIPEPETYALMLAGLAALGFVSKRRKQG